MRVIPVVINIIRIMVVLVITIVIEILNTCATEMGFPLRSDKHHENV